jgi:ribosomal protein S18 acetylase RimI-like enzyme
LECELPLPSATVYLCEAYTDPQFRGQGIAPALSNELLRRCGEEGTQLAVRATLPENHAALRAHAKNGFEVYSLMCRLKVGSWQLHWSKDVTSRGLA